MSEISDVVQIIRVEFEGMELAMKVGHASFKTMQKAALFLLTLLKHEKNKGKTGLEKLLLRGGDLQVFQFEEKDLKQVQKLCKKYGILYSMVPKVDKSSDMRELLFHAEATPRVNMMLGKLKEPGRANIKSMDKFLESTDENTLNAFSEMIRNEALEQEIDQGNLTLHADKPKENLITKVGDYVIDKEVVSVDELKKNLDLSDADIDHAVDRLSKMGVITIPDDRGQIIPIMKEDEYRGKIEALTSLNERIRAVSRGKNLDVADINLERKMIVKESPTQVKVHIPNTDTPEPVYIWLDKASVVESTDKKSMVAHIDTSHSYILHDKNDHQVGTISGLALDKMHRKAAATPSKSAIDDFIRSHVHEKKRVR